MNETDPQQIPRLAFSLLGHGLFEDPRIRTLALQTLEAGILSGLAGRFAGTVFTKGADNALVLGRLPWSGGSAFVREFGRLLAVSPEFLPQRAYAVASIETVSPPPPVQRLRPYQEEVVEQVTKQLAARASELLIQMPTGAGKTRTLVEALHSARVDREREEDWGQGPFVLWVAHTEELCEQALATFRAVWAAHARDALTLVRYWAAHRAPPETLDRAAVFSTYQKLVAASRAASPEFQRILQGPSILVVDEAHKVLAASFQRVITKIREAGETTLIGLTATPGRGFGRGRENSRLATFFDRNLVEPSESDAGLLADLQATGVLAQIRHAEIQSGEVVSLSAEEVRDTAERFDISTRVLSRLASSIPRNTAIVEAVKSHVAEGRTVLLFACSVEHSRLLTAALQLEGCVAAHIDATVNKNTRRTILDRFRRGESSVLCNFEVLSTGFDVPRVDVVVVARPTTSLVLYSQMVGRGLRGPASGGSSTCHLVDVRDNFGAFGEIERVYRAFAPHWNESRL